MSPGTRPGLLTHHLGLKSPSALASVQHGRGVRAWTGHSSVSWDMKGTRKGRRLKEASAEVGGAGNGGAGGAGGREGNNWLARLACVVLFCFITCGL